MAHVAALLPVNNDPSAIDDSPQVPQTHRQRDGDQRKGVQPCQGAPREVSRAALAGQNFSVPSHLAWGRGIVRGWGGTVHRWLSKMQLLMHALPRGDVVFKK